MDDAAQEPDSGTSLKYVQSRALSWARNWVGDHGFQPALQGQGRLHVAAILALLRWAARDWARYALYEALLSLQQTLKNCLLKVMVSRGGNDPLPLLPDVAIDGRGLSVIRLRGVYKMSPARGIGKNIRHRESLRSARGPGCPSRRAPGTRHGDRPSRCHGY